MFTQVKTITNFIPYNFTYCVTQIRLKSFKFKPKIAKNRPLKTPSALALDHFDFYCGPTFGKQWPSVRLGLLSPHKYIAVVNSFSASSDASETLLQERGAFNLINELEKISGNVKLKGGSEENTAEAKKSVSEANIVEKIPGRSDYLFSRDESGLCEFQSPKKIFTFGELQSGKIGETCQDITITGFEGQGSKILKKDHLIIYPKNLKLYVYPRNDLTDFPSPDKDILGTPTWWLLDGGSVVPVIALGLRKGEVMLDMCAAPGGKSLLASQTLLLERLVCNDVKMSRLGQLRHALASFIPRNMDIADRIILKRKDGANLKTWDELEVYDKVLVDAPCTTDRLSVNVDENNIFSTAMTSERLNLPHLQTKLLINGIRSLRPGGSLVYSTCALSPIQNEVVVENAVAIAFEKFEIEVNELSLSHLVDDLRKTGLYKIQKCKIGFLIIPFLPSNFGPMYFCKLQRIS